jgi:hypothetical protein
MRSLSERQIAVLFALFLVLSFGALAVLTGLAAPGDGGSGIALGGRPTPRPTHPPVTLVGAGDIAECDEGGAAATAALLAEIEGIVFTSGDNAYPDGSAEDYAECYHPTWGAERHRTRPVPGNHEYDTGSAEDYVRYFGAAAAAPLGETWFSFTAGAWLVVMLDSSCDEVGGCEADSAQGRWLADQLAGTDRRCTLAVWHHPLFSSGMHGNQEGVKPLWDILHAAGAEVVVNGHDHDYERFAPQDPDGAPDPENGIRQFVVGTGGANLRPFEELVPNSEARDASTHGVLRLTLREGGYDWAFLPVDGGTFTDTGSGTCR